MRLLFLMFVTEVCVLLLSKLTWPKAKSIWRNLSSQDALWSRDIGKVSGHGGGRSTKIIMQGKNNQRKFPIPAILFLRVRPL